MHKSEEQKSILSKKNFIITIYKSGDLHTSGIFMFPFLFIVNKNIYFLKKTKVIRVGENASQRKDYL